TPATVRAAAWPSWAAKSPAPVTNSPRRLTGAQTPQCFLGERHERLIRERIDRADVDLAEHVAILAGRVLRPVHEVSIPNGRELFGVDGQHATHLGQPLPLEPALQLLQVGARWRVVKPGPGLRRIGRRGTGLRRIQRIDELLTKARQAVPHLIATHDPVGEPRLINLVDDTAVALEILRAARDELIQRLLGFLAAAQRVAHANTRFGRTRVDRFHLPDTDAAVAAAF